ncbi:MAG: HAD family hydrolase [Bacteroidaceae bacterium]|nr:HAD family hydrolase [Bacteroidaceae bacterium]
MEIKQIIFDFDGTLTDTAPVILATMAATIKELGLPARTEEQCRATIGMRLEDIAEKLYPDIPGIAALCVETYQRTFKQENKPGIAKPFPGVTDTLRLLHSLGYPMAVASSRNRESLQEFIDGFGWSALFRMVIGGDDVVEAKPAPEPVLAICGKMGWQPADTLVVGDATYDILMGNNAGAQTCAVTYGNQSRDRLLTASPRFIIDRFSDLTAIIRQVNGKIS